MLKKTLQFILGYLITLISYSLVAGLFLGKSYENMSYIKDVLGMALYVFLLASATVFGFYLLSFTIFIVLRHQLKKYYWFLIVPILAITYVYLMSFHFRISSNFDAPHNYLGDYLAMVVGGIVGFSYLVSKTT
jgi:cytochrome c biogenesis protein CcdA